MESTPEAGEGSLVESLSVTERLVVEAAPSLMDIVPLGTTVSTNQLRDAGLARIGPARPPEWPLAAGATLILAPLIAGWHLPLAFVGGMKPLDFLGPIAFTFVATWLFNHTGGSVFMSIVSHSAQGTIQLGGLWSVGADFAQANLIFGLVGSAVAIGLVLFDWKSWRGPAPTQTTTPQAMAPRAAAPATPA